jgi:DNA replication protein DnaC
MSRINAADVTEAAEQIQKPRRPDTDTPPVEALEFRVQPQIPRFIDAIPDLLRADIRDLLKGAADWPLYLFGEAGTGKTCAGLCMVDRIEGAAYITVDRAIGWILDHDKGAWEWMERASLVVCDELGLRSRDSDLEYTAMKRLADIREHRRAVWISNHPPSKIVELYDERVYDRICTGTLHHLTGASRRQGFCRRVR